MFETDKTRRSYEEILEDLSDHVRQLVGVACVDPEDNLFDIGVESLMLVDIKDAIRDSLGVALKFSDFFSHFTLAALATVILQRQEGAAA